MKSKRIQSKAETKDFGQQKSIKIRLDDYQSKELVLLLILLREGLVESIEVILNNFAIYLKLNKKNNASTCSLIDLNKKVFNGIISINSLEYIVSFILKYYRDEIWEVEHIDVDFDYINGEDVTLVIHNELYKKYSKEEINKLLKL